MSTRIGVDVGGTFTDLIAYDSATGAVVLAKHPSTIEAPEAAVIESVSRALGDELVAASDSFLHGTTVGLNALLQRSGAQVGLLVTSGFRDILEIRRGSREEMLNLRWRPPTPLVPRRLRIPVRERVLASGTVLAPLKEVDVAGALETFVSEGVETIAVAFINSYCNPENELAAARSLRAHGFEGEISLSHQVSGEYREFERTSTTVIDAYVRDAAGGYLQRLEDRLRDLGCKGDLLMMRSGGGAMSFDEAAARPFETIISGPVAGVEGAAMLAAELGLAQVIATDVGGTSFDASVIIDGRPQTLNEGEVVGFPVQAPWIDVRSIGAGGGSIAEVDAGGLMRVGPRSAGSAPGPACYARGGTEPTVTDAAMALGMLAEGLLAGGLQLDPHRAAAALSTLTSALETDIDGVARGMMRVASAHMADAIHEITVERGLDPRDGALMAFGGAGGLFATLLATETDIETVVIPPYCGNFSAWGLLSADITRTAARTLIMPLDGTSPQAAERVVRTLIGELDRRPGKTGVEDTQAEAALDLRYTGQEYSLTIPLPFADDRVVGDSAQMAKDFENEYERIFGHRIDETIEVVAVRATLRMSMAQPLHAQDAVGADASEPDPSRTVRAFSFTEAAWTEFLLLDRGALPVGYTQSGPALVAEPTGMTYVDSGFQSTVNPTGCLVLERQARTKSDA